MNDENKQAESVLNNLSNLRSNKSSVLERRAYQFSISGCFILLPEAIRCLAVEGIERVKLQIGFHWITSALIVHFGSA